MLYQISTLRELVDTGYEKGAVASDSLFIKK